MIRVVIDPGVFISALIGRRGGAPDQGRPPKSWTKIDRDHETLRRNMQTLFNDLGIATKAAAPSTTLCRSRPATLLATL